jgi:protocatechuate 3,4-dioxygenase beta subunit
MAAAAESAQEQADAAGTATLGGTITVDGAPPEPVDGVTIDLFAADQAGNRVSYLRSVTSGAQGGQPGQYRFAVEPGCYSITAIAPTGRTFTNDQTWVTVGRCIGAGQSQTDIDATLRSTGRTTVTGTVLRSDTGKPVDGVTVDLFTATADGGRGRYLTSVDTGSGWQPGRYSLDVEPGCYVTTYIAPDGATWESTGNTWLNRGICAQPGQSATVDPAVTVLPSAPSEPLERVAAINAVVTRGGVQIGGLDFDVFEARPDGSRGRYLASGTTGSGPTSGAGATVTAAAADVTQFGSGCWIVTVIAAQTDRFEDSGTRWHNRTLCPEANTTTYQIEAVLTGPPPETCAAGAEFELVVRDDFNEPELGEDWVRYHSAGNAGYGLRRMNAVTVENGKLVITAQMIDGTLVSGGLSQTLVQRYGKYRFRVRTDRDPSLAMSGVVLTWPESGVHPRDGENNVYETLTTSVDRNPFYSFIHEPYGTVHDQVYIEHHADGTQFQTMSLEWTPERIVITREGPGGPNYTDRHVIIENSDDLIPDNPHFLAIQLDAWKHSLDQPVRMEVDWVETYEYCTQF